MASTVGQIQQSFDDRQYYLIKTACANIISDISGMSGINDGMITAFYFLNENMHTLSGTVISELYEDLNSAWKKLNTNVGNLSQYVKLVEAATENIAAAGNIAGHTESNMKKVSFDDFSGDKIKFNEPGLIKYDNVVWKTDVGEDHLNTWVNLFNDYKNFYESVKSEIHKIHGEYEEIGQLEIMSNISKFANSVTSSIDETNSLIDNIVKTIPDEAYAKSQAINEAAMSADVTVSDDVSSGSATY